MKENGYLPHRRGIWQHLRDGRMTLQDVAVHAYISSQADTRTGIWQGSAGALAGELCISRRLARRFLERLRKGDYIRRFPIPGRHVCYPILIHKFLLTDGEHKGEHLNALASASPMDLRYFPGQQEGEQKGEHVTSQKRELRMETREESLRQAGSRRSSLGPLELAKVALKPSTNARRPGIASARTAPRLRHFSTRPLCDIRGLASSHYRLFRFDRRLHGEARRKSSLFHFSIRYVFVRPDLEKQSAGGINGKPGATELAVRNARALGLAN